jgi:hypothetical protein
MTTREAAIIRAGERFAAARAERDALNGPSAVAAAACPSGTDKDRAVVARLYTQLQHGTQDGPPEAA